MYVCKPATRAHRIASHPLVYSLSLSRARATTFFSFTTPTTTTKVDPAPDRKRARRRPPRVRPLASPRCTRGKTVGTLLFATMPPPPGRVKTTAAARWMRMRQRRGNGPRRGGRWTTKPKRPRFPRRASDRTDSNACLRYDRQGSASETRT